MDASSRTTGCSTPEGIETVISIDEMTDVERHVDVLNARRHRDGDQARPPWNTST